MNKDGKGIEDGSEKRGDQEGIRHFRAEVGRLNGWHHELTEGPRHIESGGHASIFDSRIVKLVWNVDDVARELECSVRHVRKLVSENRIPYLKIGRLVRFSPLRVREWLHKGGTR